MTATPIASTPGAFRLDVRGAPDRDGAFVYLLKLTASTDVPVHRHSVVLRAALPANASAAPPSSAASVAGAVVAGAGSDERGEMRGRYQRHVGQRDQHLGWQDQSESDWFSLFLGPR